MQRATDELRPEGEDFFCDALTALRRGEVSFLVGGAYALNRYTGISRHTHDIDVFVHKANVERALAVLASAGYRTELTHPHWLAKALRRPDELDLIFNSGNGLAPVDDLWFEHAVEDEVLGVPVRLVPPEELIWSKAYVMERERFDGADILHILRASAERIDWHRLVRRFGAHYRVLLTHLVLFGFAYPGERDRIPGEVLRELMERGAQLVDVLPRETYEREPSVPACRSSRCAATWTSTSCTACRSPTPKAGCWAWCAGRIWNDATARAAWAVWRSGREFAVRRGFPLDDGRCD